jgi:hypothetical protein
LARALDQEQQNLEWLLGELDSQALLAELTRDKVELEHAEAYNFRCGRTHRKLRANSVSSRPGSREQRVAIIDACNMLRRRELADQIDISNKQEEID